MQKKQTTEKIVKVSMLIALSIILSKLLSFTINIGGYPSIKVSFAHVPIIISGILLGGKYGFACGFLADFLGSLVGVDGGSLTIFKFLFSISSGLMGVIPAIILKLDKKNKYNFSKFNIFFVTIVYILVLLLYKLRGVSFNENKDLYIGVLLISILFIVVPRFILRRLNIELSNWLEKIYFAVFVSRVITSMFMNTYFISLLIGKSFLFLLPFRIVTNLILIPLISMLVFTILNSLKNTYKL